MKILIAGASGLVGKALVSFLRQQGDDVYQLTRHFDPSSHVIAWDPEKNQLDPDKLEGFDAVINLAGDNISSGRWTKAKKQKIHDSRVQSTQLLAQTMAKLNNPPKVFINASATGYYGNTEDTVVDESSYAGRGFLAQVCKDWEAAVEPAREAGIRTVLFRTGMVLSTKGGALAKMLTPFRLGMGGVIGSGKQYMSWITLDELLEVICFGLHMPTLSGPLNAVTPFPVTNHEFTKTLGHVLHRPTIVPMPAWLARIVFGEMADELLLASSRVIPDKLIQEGYHFRDPKLEDALEKLLKKF